MIVTVSVGPKNNKVNKNSTQFLYRKPGKEITQFGEYWTKETKSVTKDSRHIKTIRINLHVSFNEMWKKKHAEKKCYVCSVECA